MFAYIVRRLALMLVTLIGISIIIFVLLRVVPCNIVDILFDATGFVDHDPMMGDQDVDAVKQTIGTYREAFPDIHITIEDIFEVGGPP